MIITQPYIILSFRIVKLMMKIKMVACKKTIGRAEKWGRRFKNKVYLTE